MLLIDVLSFELLQERANEERGGEEAPAVLTGEWPTFAAFM